MSKAEHPAAVEVKAHPAPYSGSIMAVLMEVLTTEVQQQRRQLKVLDPMAGKGTIHELANKGVKTFGIELEPEWAAAHTRTMIGDATAMPRRWRNRFDATVTSPDYGNRMADDFEASDGGQGRIGYRWALGRSLSERTVVVPWGDAYRELHLRVLVEMERVTRAGGLVIVNVSDFIEDRKVVPVVSWYRDVMEMIGLSFERDIEVQTPRMRKGQNHEARVDHENVLVYRKLLA